jgi:Skp family chaperone for outer membrane proteins
VHESSNIRRIAVANYGKRLLHVVEASGVHEREEGEEREGKERRRRRRRRRRKRNRVHESSNIRRIAVTNYGKRLLHVVEASGVQKRVEEGCFK